MHFKVEQEIFEKLPNACFGVVVAKGIDNTKDYPQIYEWLEEGIQTAAQRFEGKKVKEEGAILPYREAFRALGINPNKYMCSIEALFTRIAKGKGMPHINPVVDLGNAVSLKYTLPMGAHDLKDVTEGISVRMTMRETPSCLLAAQKKKFWMMGKWYMPQAARFVLAVGHGVRVNTGKLSRKHLMYFSPLMALQILIKRKFWQRGMNWNRS